MKGLKVKEKNSKVFSTTSLLILSFYTLILFFPLFWVTMTSFKSAYEFSINKIGLPEQLNFKNYMEFYRRLIPYCEQYNIQVAVENMWQYVGKKITHSTCSRPQEFIRYLDELNSKWVVGCLDIGHAYLVGEKAEDCIYALGKDRLKALHVHDVDGIDDSHTIPYFGIGNWEEVEKALKKIGYQGDFTYEAGGFLTNYPKDLVSAGLSHMVKIARYIISEKK